ncbi:hypothetical protein [Roseibium aggregatum]|uniref:hypothetical protein n=1 Tax=Roseibium aggregatum TaxID=187304 RepID=UPI001F2FF770|nr:hypothetical protein [Roseibium aggregatum]
MRLENALRQIQPGRCYVYRILPFLPSLLSQHHTWRSAGGGVQIIKHVYRPRSKATKRPEVAVTAERGGRIRAAFLPSSDGEQIGRVISPDAHIMSDDDKAIGKAAHTFKEHDTITHGKKKNVRGKPSLQHGRRHRGPAEADAARCLSPAQQAPSSAVNRRDHVPEEPAPDNRDN